MHADATVVLRHDEPRQRGTGGVPGRPRAAGWDDQTIAEGRTYYQAHPELHGHGKQMRAAHAIAGHLHSKGVSIDADADFRTIVRRVIKGEDYKHASDKTPQQTKS